MWLELRDDGCWWLPGRGTRLHGCTIAGMALRRVVIARALSAFFVRLAGAGAIRIVVNNPTTVIRPRRAYAAGTAGRVVGTYKS